MEQDRWLEANTIFESVVELPAEEQRIVLEAACSHDPSLLPVVQRLLEADAQAEHRNFLGNAPDLTSPPSSDASRPTNSAEAGRPMPERIGPYRIVREIGRGGMGTIYEAVRDDGTMDHRVAVKVVRAGVENEDIARRMRLERRILARLQHPNIARSYDAGTTESGSPFFAMELLDGLPIDQYCRRHHLGLTARLRLVRKVCRAVAYANDNLVAHRDIKASNILVTSDGEPKLLDFGIAKVLEPDALGDPEAGRKTEPWHRRMTLDYASPEQIRGQPVTLSCDVYSLGVLLFLLLTGEMPRSSEGLTPWLFERQLRSTDPPKPSRAVAGRSSVEQSRSEQSSTEQNSTEQNSTEVTAGIPLGRAQLARRLNGDLDSIVLGALQEDPRSRYGSAKELADDLDRYLNGFPVQARHAGATYRFGKFLRRHAKAVTVALLFFATAAGLMVSVIRAGRQAEKSRLELAAENDRRQKLLEVFLGIFAQAGPLISEGVDLSLRQAVERFLETSPELFLDDPTTRGDILSTLGWIFSDLGDPKKALSYHRQSLDIRESLQEGSAIDLIDSKVGVAAATRDLWQLEEAERLSREALDLMAETDNLPAAFRLAAINHHVGILCHKRDWQAAEPFTLRALDLSRELGAADSYEKHIAATQRARVVRRLGHLAEARDQYGEALKNLQRAYGAEHPLLPLIHNNLGELAYRLEEYDAAIESLSRADLEYSRIYGEDFYNRALTLNSLGRAFLKAGRAEEGEAALRRAVHVALTSPALAARHERAYFGPAAVKLAEVWIAAGRCDEVLDLLAERHVSWKDHKVTRRAAEQVELCRERSSAL